MMSQFCIQWDTRCYWDRIWDACHCYCICVQVSCS